MTLIELLIVIVLIALAGGLLIPSSHTAEPELLRVAGEVLAADLALARSLALLEGKTYRVIFAPDGDQYTIVPDPPGRLPVSLPFTAGGQQEGQLAFRLSDIPQAGRTARVLTVLPTGPASQAAVEFTPFGSLNRDQNVSIVLGLTQRAREWRVMLTVDAVTGRCELGEPFCPSDTPVGNYTTTPPR